MNTNTNLRNFAHQARFHTGKR